VPEKGGKTGGNARFDTPVGCDRCGSRALQGIEQQRGGGKLPVAGSEHIRRADIAGADLAYVTEAGHPRQNEAERDRAQQITENKACESRRQPQLPGKHVHRSPLPLTRAGYAECTSSPAT
jgi:hypothetical protein